MSESRVVNALLESLANAPGPKREPIRVGRRLAYCQQVCPEWFRGCGRYSTAEWVDRLILVRLDCDRMPADRG